MNAHNILKQLSFTEFRNLSLSNDGDGTIRKADMGALLTYINDGMSALVTQFQVTEKVVHVQLYDHITTYHLLSRFAVSQQPQPHVDYPYILDLNGSPFKGDVNKVKAVWDNTGRKRVLNDESDMRSIFIMGKEAITVPYPENGVILFVHYQAKPMTVTVDNLDEEVDIPDSLVPTLRAYVAHRLFMSMGTSDSMRIGQEYQTQYVMLINDLKSTDALSDSRFTESPFYERGWI